MPFVRVPDVRARLAALGLACGAVSCDARPNALGRLRDGIDSLRQATRAAAALGATIVPFTFGVHPDRSDERALGLVGRELRAAAALAAEVGVRLAIEVGDDGPGIDPTRTEAGARGVLAAAGAPRTLGLVLRGEAGPAAPDVFARRMAGERPGESLLLAAL